MITGVENHAYLLTLGWSDIRAAECARTPPRHQEEHRAGPDL